MHLTTFLCFFSPLLLSNFATADLKVGIIGAGASGLYAAILLQSLGIDYEILEASERSGGRIWTHYFDPPTWKASRAGRPEFYDYFDVGAMRIPQMPFMDRLVGNESNSLVQYINRRVSSPDKLTLIPYIFSNNNTFLHYNHILRKSSDPLTNDPFKTGLPAFSRSDPHEIWANIINNFTSTLSANFAQGFAQLSRHCQSARQYLTTLKFSFLEINWLETFLDATGHFDSDLTEIVLEDWLFDAGNDGGVGHKWTTIEGGMSRLINGMSAILTKAILFSERVTAISQAAPNGSIAVTTNLGTTRVYDHVINTVPLGAMQAMDMTSLNLGFAKESAMRMINYDASMKLGVKFKSRWWQELANPIFGGQSVSDLPIRTCVYPSYGINVTGAAAVMIVSYTWGQDASRLASYLPNPNPNSNSNSPSSTKDLLNLTLSSLATLNNVSLSFLQSQYVDHFAYSWYESEYSVGAFPEFGPGQFAELMPVLMEPVAGGKVHLGGDALSAGHAWIVGGLNAAFRCVREVLEVEAEAELVQRLEKTWGPLIDISPSNGADGALFDDIVATSRKKRGSTFGRSRPGSGL